MNGLLELVTADMNLPRDAFKSVDITREPELARAHKITRIPTLVVIEDGKEVDRLFGVQGKERLQELLSQQGRKNETLPTRLRASLNSVF